MTMPMGAFPALGAPMALARMHGSPMSKV
jgi:hypothetical protein